MSQTIEAWFRPIKTMNRRVSIGSIMLALILTVETTLAFFGEFN